jgi:osmoprotectant transport system permease protein
MPKPRFQVVNMATSIPTLGKLALMMSTARHRRASGDRRPLDRDVATDHSQHLRRIRAVPEHLIDAARGMGMGPRPILRRVELPNALFVIFAGVRTAMAVNVGTAPIAFLIGGGGLG